MNSRHSPIIIAGIVCAFAGTSVRSAQGHAPPAPCALLTATEVSAAMGMTVSDGKPINTVGCKWDVASQASVKQFVTLMLIAPARFEGMKKPIAGAAQSDPSGIGDEAIYTTILNWTTLSVKKGSVDFVLRIYGLPDNPKQMAIEKTLALDAVAKM